MKTIIYTLLTLLCSPALAVAGSFGARMDEAILPSLLFGVALLLVVQGGHHFGHRILRLVRFRRVRRTRQRR